VNEPTARRGAQWGVLVCVTCAAIAVAAGVAAVVLDEPVLALVASASAVAAAAVGTFLDVRRTRAEQSLLEARAQNRGLSRQLQAFELQASTARSSTGEPADEWDIDPASGLISERHLPVVLQQVLASARRKVQPVSVVFWELDGPIVRVTTPHVPLAAANNLEDAQLPTPERIVESVRKLVD